MFTQNGCETFGEDSAREARRISGERQLRKAYAAFFLTPDGRNFARKFGRTYSEPVPRPNGNGNEPEFHDLADLPVSSVCDHPINHIEPLNGHISLRGMEREEIDKVCETFKFAFRWALDGAQSANGDSPLVCVGKRCNVILARMRPDLGVGLILKPALCRRFDRRFSEITLLRTGVWFGRVLEWIRRGEPISARGERVYVLAYQLWPADIGAATLAKLGLMNGKTRQAKDKQANCFRDTISRRSESNTVKALTMRGDITRFRCKNAQLSQ